MSSITQSLRRIAASQSASARELLTLRLYSSSAIPTKTWSKYKKKPLESPPAPAPPAPPLEPPPPPPPKVWPRPSTIPYQAKAANSLSLIGYVETPVQFETAADGKFWAGTTLTRKASSGSHFFWIPIIFEGDLAHVASSHLKENDLVCIDGQVISDPPPLDASRGVANVQVMVSSVSFVEETKTSKKSVASREQGATLNHSASTKDGGDSALIPWRELLDHPGDWTDYREQKLAGSVKPRHPDFKRNDGSLSLWLSSAPPWVWSQLVGRESDTPMPKSKRGVDSKGDEAWRDLVRNPAKWWDNRVDKKNPRGPDFKHKESGEALWLRGAPAWVRPNLPPLQHKTAKATDGDTGFLDKGLEMF